LIKGILHPDDAIHAVDAGCDGIIVSNHGGRQLDCGPASIDALPAIAAVVQQKVPLILDSGVRRGADIIRAKALGASFVLAGRAFAYGAASGGEAGVHRAFGILETELRRCLGQLGKHDFAGVDSSILHMPHGIGGQGALPEPVK
jgi:L-lactate dehydrogenase (cytochrome)/(S)-mandelate dehydrogenase